jgi:hypothetical protein
LSLQTEFEFTLPKGFVDATGQLHRVGVMRLATARDEVEPLRDPRVQQNEAYLTIIVLARVVQRLGSIAQITPHEIESLFSSDLAYLQELYGIINFGDPEELQEFRAAHGELGEAGADADQPEGDEETPGVPFGRRGGFVDEVVAGE